MASKRRHWIRAHGVRKEAQDSLNKIRAELAARAPRGLEDLQRQLAGLPGPAAGDPSDLPSVDEAETALQAASALAGELGAGKEVVRERRDRARTEQAEAMVRQEAAVERLIGARTALDRLAIRDEAELSAHAESADDDVAKPTRCFITRTRDRNIQVSSFNGFGPTRASPAR